VDIRRAVGSGTGGGGGSSPDCVMEWTIAALGDAAARTITLFGHTAATLNNYDVDWGDGSAIETGITTVDKTHEYPSDASIQTYVVTITDQFGGLRMQRSPQANRDKLTKFVNWGTSQINGVYGMFMGCSNMLYEATDSPDLTSLIAQFGDILSYAFYDCSSIVNLDLTGWDASSFTQMYETFRGTDNCETLNLSGWTLPSLTSLYKTFYEVGKTSGCNLNLSNVTMALAGLDARKAFRYTNFSVSPNLTNFDISGVDDMDPFMDLCDGAADIHVDLSDLDFTNAVTSFNSFASSCGVGSITFGSGSDFGSITTMANAFAISPNLTSVIFPSNCDFSALTTFSRAFYLNSNQTTIDLGTIQDFGNIGNVGTVWQTFRGLGTCSINFLTTTNIQSTTSLTNILYQTTIQPTQYDNLLVALSTANGGIPHVGGSLGTNSCNYSLGSPGETARTLLLSAPYNWTITDAGGV